MAHPLDEHYQKELIAAVVTKAVMDAGEDIKEDICIPVSIMHVLSAAPSYEEIIRRAADAAKKGAVAGDLLDYIAQMYFTERKQPSVRKAVYVAGKYLSHPKDGYGKKSGASNIFMALD